MLSQPGDLCSIVLLVRERQCRHDLLSSRVLSFLVVMNSLPWYNLDEDEDGKKEGLCWNRFHSIPAAMPAFSMKLITVPTVLCCSDLKVLFASELLRRVPTGGQAFTRWKIRGRFHSGRCHDIARTIVTLMHFGLFRSWEQP